MEYKEFLETKKIKTISTGFECDDFNPMLFDWQKDIVKWALKKGRSCIFADCGLGKTPMQLEWANKVHEYTGKPVLIFAPLAVSKQTQREGEKFHIDVTICRTQQDVIDGINITNYEMMEHFNPDVFGGLVLDESSIIKHQTSKTRNKILEMFADTQFKLACTATPAPNDHMELGNHAEFVGAMTQTEMLSTFFINDVSHGVKWRLKGHAKNSFWEWLASWACVITKPSDLGYDDNGFNLPQLHIEEHIVKSDNGEQNGQLMMIPKLASTLSERRQARRDSMADRCELAKSLLIDGQNLVWCDLNDESKYLTEIIGNAVEVKGSDTDKHKTNSMLDFAKNEVKTLVTKPKIAGFGMNWQNCHNMIFVGLSDSYEMMYQAIRRCWRFGQTQDVNVHIVISEAEGAVKRNIERKEKQSQEMITEMVKYTKDILTKEIHGIVNEKIEYNANIEMTIPTWLRSEK